MFKGPSAHTAARSFGFLLGQPVVTKKRDLKVCLSNQNLLSLQYHQFYQQFNLKEERELITIYSHLKNIYDHENKKRKSKHL